MPLLELGTLLSVTKCQLPSLASFPSSSSNPQARGWDMAAVTSDFTLQDHTICKSAEAAATASFSSIKARSLKVWTTRLQQLTLYPPQSTPHASKPYQRLVLPSVVPATPPFVELDGNEAREGDGRLGGL
ncbi:hypothetical protein Ae201684P_012428 [Aphanomyces euteiches]|nr:hypothetical protein Ae201684P_012428 [Aphanomyces euteiches]